MLITKFLRRYCSVFVCALLLSIGFSSIAKADETKLENLKIEISSSITQNDINFPNQFLSNSNITIYPNNKTVEKSSTPEFSVPMGSTYRFFQKWKVSNSNGNILFSGGKNVKFRLENGYYNIGYQLINNSNNEVYSSTYIIPKYNTVLVEYYDGKYEYIEFSSGVKIGRPTTLYLDFTPQKDVVSIEFSFGSGKIDLTDTTKYFKGWAHVGEQTSDDSFKIVIDTESVEAGLLSGIIGFLKNIYDHISFLPQLVWEVQKQGIINLIVPDEEFLDEFKAKMDNMLSSKFGAVYEVANVLFEGWDRIKANDVSNTIDFPEVTIPLPNDNEFSFGGFTVTIVPEGFEWLATSIKSLVGIVCTASFVNSMKKRYDDTMSP